MLRYLQLDIIKNFDSRAFQSSKTQNFLQPWRSLSHVMKIILFGAFQSSGEFKIWIAKFYLAMVKVSTMRYHKKIILEHFRAPKLKNFFNHGEVIHKEISLKFHFEAFYSSELKIFFKYGEGFTMRSHEYPSFWSISELWNGKFSSSLVKVFTKKPH